MKMSFVCARALLASAAVFAFAAATRGAVQATYYVAPDGSDTNAGTLSAPFQTLEKARDTVRPLLASMTGDIEVVLRGGTYARTATFALTNADGGTGTNYVVYRAYAGEFPVIDGGKEITGWSLH